VKSRLDSGLQQLVELGLNELEAQVYLFLLSNRPMTAYGVARQIGKATANTYKAIESLARRGAVLVEDGENRQCRAVPAREFMAHLERTFSERTRATEATLASLQVETHDERVYKVESVPQLLERARQMIAERAERLITVDAFPKALERIAPSLRNAASRGISVYVQSYAPIKIEGAHVIVAPRGREAEAYWNSQQLNLVIDGREALIALLDNEFTQIHQALWSNSLYLSCLLHAGMTSEQTVHRLLEARTARDSTRRINAVLDEHRFFLNSDVPGQIELLARFVPPATA
jgi:HTH-type transcriptional regulator, sugar sensing transcriptional regulator